jgi:tetraprenyl-beta-curcumene synthase
VREQTARVVAACRRRLALAKTFTITAAIYWLDVFPPVDAELARWRGLAARIPDPRLRELALETQHAERGNLEGAAAFAVLAPRARRRDVVRAVVAFQALYDYLDTLAEQPGADSWALHLALPAALDTAAEHDAGAERALAAAGPAGGYIGSLVARCQGALAGLPSWQLVAVPALRSAERMVHYQGLIHDHRDRRREALGRWAAASTPAGSGLRWWETAAAAASSLGVFALIASAARAELDPAGARAIETAYFPWIGALHVLLDSLVDSAADAAAGHHSLVAGYDSSEQTAVRLAAIAARAAEAARTVERGELHELILAAMTSFYLVGRGDWPADGQAAAAGVLATLGTPARASGAILLARQGLARSAHLLATPMRRGPCTGRARFSKVKYRSFQLPDAWQSVKDQAWAAPTRTQRSRSS